jgi:hypothetical protein
MNHRIITIALATLVPAAAAAAPAAPRVDARTAEADRAYVRTVGILGLLQEEGSAAATVLGSAHIGAELSRAVDQLKGRSFASTSFDALRRPTSSESSVTIGAVRAPSEQTFELAQHRAHRVRVPSAR